VTDQAVPLRPYAYDYLSRLLCASNPETKVGSTSCANLPLPSSGVDLFEYDGNGNLTKRTDSRGVIVNLSYDTLNRLTQKTYPAGTETATFTHDTGCRKGALCSVATASSTTTYGYDTELRVTSSQQNTAGQAFPFVYTYNEAGLPTSIQYPSGRTVSSTYDDAGRPLTTYRTGYTYASSVAYEPDSALAQIRYGNNLYEGRCYNDRRQLNAFYVSTVTGSTCNPASFSLKITSTFVSPNNGNLASQVIADGSTTRTQNFDYDYANRLNQFVESGGLSQLYNHDAWGNRWVSSSSIPLHLATPTSQGNYNDATNRLTGVTYDNTGNITNHPVLGVFTWDAESRLATAAPPSGPATTFTYDGHSRRVKKGNIIYVYDAFGRLAQEVNGPPPPTNITYLSPDHLGSTRLVTGGDATPLRRLDYFPFGEQMGQGINGRPAIYGSTAFGYTDVVGQKFTAKERDAETGLDWMKARYFSGAQGRFTSPDKPFADQFPEDPQSWNLYSYVRNNPLKMVDEDGQSATLIGGIGGGIIGGAVAAWRGESVWKGAASGAIAGAVAGSVIDTGGASLGVLALSGAAGGLTGGVVSRGLNGEGTTLKQAAVDAAVGGTVGVVLGAGGKAVSAALSKSAPAVAESVEAGASSRVQGIAKQIEDGGFKVTANPKTPNQTGNVTITHPESNKQLNLRVETGPTPQGNQPHANVQVMRPNQRIPTKLKEESNVHIYE